MTLLPKELASIEAWFSDLQEALDLGQNVDRGRVLAAVRKLKGEATAAKEQVEVIAAAYGYKRVGDLYRDCLNKVGKTPEVELPAVFSEPPIGWLDGRGRSYAKAVKRLRGAQDLIKRVWADIEQEAQEQEEGWGVETLQAFIDAFSNSTDPDSFERTCYEHLTGYEEEDPATTWVDAAELAERPLSMDSNLPTLAVTELLAYSRRVGVVVTKQVAERYGEGYWPAGSWFDYLLTTYLLNSTRTEGKEVLALTGKVERAMSMTELVSKVRGANPSMPGLVATVWEPSVSLAQLKAAYDAYLVMEERGDDVTVEEMEATIREATREALASNN